MAYKALYRTYRPQSFEEVAGQQHIVRTLKNALATNKIAHAYLFCGPRGTGKTTMAKLFAKALNCEQGIGCQCNECENCKEITEGLHPDVIEIDAASNNGVEEVRNLIEKVNYLPLKGKYKVYIIDEVHMMTDNAFNALLKTLEEPPAHVIFILATTEPHEILPTILSRCQRYDFTKVSDADIEERIMKILELEGISYNKEAVRSIITLADGGMRDALSILDQVLAFSGNKLSEEDVITLFGLTSTQEKIEFLLDINNGDVSNAISKIYSFQQAGVDLKRLTNDLLEILKDVLIYKKTNDDAELSFIREEDADKLVQSISIKKINEMIMSFLKAQTEYKTVNNIRTMFEIVVLRLCTLDDVIDNDVKTQVAKPKITQPKVESPIPTNIEQPLPNTKEIKIEPQKQITNISLIPEESLQPSRTFELPIDGSKIGLIQEGDLYSFDDSLFIQLMVIGDKNFRKEIIQKWTGFDAYINHQTYSNFVKLLKDSRPLIATKEILVLEFDFEKQANQCNIKANQETIGKIIRYLTGKNLFVIGVSRSDGVRLIKSFHNLRQISQLPRAENIEINIEEIK